MSDLLGLERIIVSIPYGKGKAADMLAERIYKEMFQFPMGKVKSNRRCF